MKIHHYTSIETLEMILKNKSIKFNRFMFMASGGGFVIVIREKK